MICDFIVDSFLTYIKVQIIIYLSDYQVVFNFCFTEINLNFEVKSNHYVRNNQI